MENSEKKSKLSSEREQNGVVENKTIPKYGANLYKSIEFEFWKMIASFAIVVIVDLVGNRPIGILIVIDVVFAFAVISGCLYLAKKILINVICIEKYSEEKQKMVSYIAFIVVIILVFLMFFYLSIGQTVY